jgi:hypothetical protein
MSDGASGSAPSDMSMGGGFTTLIQIFVSISSALCLTPPKLYFSPEFGIIPKNAEIALFDPRIFLNDLL